VGKAKSETITRVLYPNDETYEGRELRYRQQVFFVQATLKDLIRRYLKNHDDLLGFSSKNAIQLNDTHPALAVSELMRLLIDIYQIPWDKAWDITQATLAYTNHTLLPEALEKWDVELMERVTPRNLEVIYEINRRFLDEVHLRWPGDHDRRTRMSIVAEGDRRQIRMAHLAMIGSHSVNGVAALHTELLKERVVPDFAEMYPEKFNNKTNGVTQRRWMNQANPLLSKWITERIGDRWIVDLDEIKNIEHFTNKKADLKSFREIKIANKARLAGIIKQETGIIVDPESIFDIQIKRIHEYKRQHLNALHIMYLYNKIKRNPEIDMVPRTFIFGGKAAPGYFLAKRIIKLIGNIARLVNNDPDVSHKIKVVFLPNYRVSLAEKMFPAADVSEQISTAGKEASGTGNMKFALNGALTIGTLDGANVEILEEVGNENIVIFGLEAQEIQEMRPYYNPYEIYENSPHIKEVLDQMNSDFLSPNDPSLFEPIFNSLVHQGDQFFVLADFDAYIEAQEKVEELYKDKDNWTKITMLNMCRCGKFSSDRTIREYATEIWGIEPLSICLPDSNGVPCE
jgi:starch phosphorylase